MILAALVGLAVVGGSPVTLEEDPAAQFAAIAARGDRKHVVKAYDQRGGFRYDVDGQTVGEGTGPPRIAVGPDGWLLAHADRDGDVAITTRDGTKTLTDGWPEDQTRAPRRDRQRPHPRPGAETESDNAQAHRTRRTGPTHPLNACR